MQIRISKVVLSAVLAFSSCLGWTQTRVDAEKDPVLKAMLQELDRNKKQLQLQNFEKPFYIEYRVEDIQEFETLASYGSAVHARRNHQRVARVTVLIGNYKTDSSTPRGEGGVQMTTIDDDPIALRSSLWAATDNAYKAALHAYTQKQAALKQVQTPPQADDFSQEKPVIILEEPQRLELNENEWMQRTSEASGLYRSATELKEAGKAVQISSSTFRGRVLTRYQVNTEGTIIRKSQPYYSQAFVVTAQAPDGMRLERSYGTNGTALNQLDSADVFRKHAVGLVSALQELRNAPLVEEEYHGPLLISNDAAADVVDELIASSIVAQRPDLGTEARTKGPYASSFHSRVLADFLDVTDDPNKKFLGKKGLVGAYSVDDEGVKAQAVPVIVHGKLQNYLIGRVPVRDFPQSNGHGRATIGRAARPSVGVLEMTASESYSNEELNKKLIEIAKDRGLKNVYYLETLGPELTPRLLYRIGTDGKRQLVRGALLEEMDQRSLRSGILAAGKEPFIANYMRDIPTTVIAPALLFEDITVKRANEKNGKLPYYAPPQE